MRNIISVCNICSEGESELVLARSLDCSLAEIHAEDIKPEKRADEVDVIALYVNRIDNQRANYRGNTI